MTSGCRLLLLFILILIIQRSLLWAVNFSPEQLHDPIDNVLDIRTRLSSRLGLVQVEDVRGDWLRRFALSLRHLHFKVPSVSDRGLLWKSKVV